jgi:acyl-CoA thioesterase I
MNVDMWKRGLFGLILGAAAMTTFAAAPPKILVVGDSLSAEYGLARGTGWVALLEKKLASDKINALVVNASISGDTTSGGLSRLPTLLTQHKPTIVVIELGGNDALRGMAMTQTEQNFSRMAELATRAGAKVLLLGMQVPPNMGPTYAKEFAAVYQHVAKSNKVALVPFFLKGVADAPNSRTQFQADGIHPIATAHPTMLANVWPELKKLLK